MKNTCRWAVAGWLLAALQCFAQSPEERVARLVASYPPVTFASEVKDRPADFGSVSNTIYKPAGDGPFAAVVLVHTCAGIDDRPMRQHARELLDSGMVVLLQDSFGPRGRANCGINNSQSLPEMAGVIDAYAALVHLGKQPFVDKERIYQAGYSWGGIVATLLGSPRLAAMLKAPARFRATVANYSPCRDARGSLVSDALDRPLLMLLGEKDDETPPATCFPMLDDYKAKALPVAWHVYSGATHGWDKQGQARNGYFYNADVARDATKRMLDFFAQHK
jgi:dienelactone hydrolase